MQFVNHVVTYLYQTSGSCQVTRGLCPHIYRCPHEPSLVTRSIKGMRKLYTRASSMVGYSILSLPLLFFALQGRPHKLCDWPISAQPGNNIPYCAMAAMQCEIFTMHCTGAFDIQHEKSTIYMQE